MVKNMGNKHILDEVFQQGTRVALLRELYFARRLETGRRLADLAGASPMSGHTHLRALVKLGLVNQTPAGNKVLFSLDHSHPLIKGFIGPVFEYERAQERGLSAETPLNTSVKQEISPNEPAPEPEPPAKPAGTPALIKTAPSDQVGAAKDPAAEVVEPAKKLIKEVGSTILKNLFKL